MNVGTTPPTANENVAHAAAVREAAVEHAPKHTRLIRSARAGGVLSALMLPLFLLRPPAGYGVITTIGRKSGKKRRRCIRVIRRGNEAYTVQLRPPAPWSEALQAAYQRKAPGAALRRPRLEYFQRSLCIRNLRFHAKALV